MLLVQFLIIGLHVSIQPPDAPPIPQIRPTPNSRKGRRNQQNYTQQQESGKTYGSCNYEIPETTMEITSATAIVTKPPRIK